MKSINSKRRTTDPEYIDLLNYIIGRTENVESPMNIQSLAREFKKKSGAPQSEICLAHRIETLRTTIQTFKHIDTNTKVKFIFAMSASVYVLFLKKLRKNAVVEVNEKNQILHYKANDGSLELRGDHSQSARNSTGQFDSRRTILSWIIDYFENKNDSNAVPANKEEKEMWNLIDFITEKCENVNSPLSISSMAKEFNKNFRTSGLFGCVCGRVKGYCREIQNIEFSNTHSKVKQLFCLSVRLNSNCLQELRKDAVVEVDDQNRITKYTSNNGLLTLHGDHSQSAKIKLGWRERGQDKEEVKKHCSSGGHENEESGNEIDYSEDDSDGYSSEEIDSDSRNIHLDEYKDFIKLSDEVHHNDNKTTDISIDDNPFDPPTERSHLSEEIGMREDDGRKRKNRFSTAATPEKKQSIGITGFGSSNWTGSICNSTMRPNELDDYDTNYSIVDRVKLEPFRGSIQEDLKGIEEDNEIQQISRPLQALDELNECMEVPIKMESEETVEIKPETSHNSKIKFFEAMQSLILFLDTLSLSWIQSKIHKKILKVEGSEEVMPNNEFVLNIELLIARITNHSVLNLSENEESVKLSYFLCYLKAAILNSKMSGVEGLMKKISKLIEESQDKIILMENVANVLRDTLVVESF